MKACFEKFIRCAAAVALASAFASEAKAEAAPQSSMENIFLGSFSGKGAAQDVEHGSRTVSLSGSGTRISGGLRVALDAVFSDGERNHVVWTFSKLGDGSYIGHRDDLIGNAQVTEKGDDVEMSYQARIGSKGGAKTLAFDEHFVLTLPNTIVDRLSATFLLFNVASGEIMIAKNVGKPSSVRLGRIQAFRPFEEAATISAIAPKFKPAATQRRPAAV